jgi:hypothetical protein
VAVIQAAHVDAPRQIEGFSKGFDGHRRHPRASLRDQCGALHEPRK